MNFTNININQLKGRIVGQPSLKEVSGNKKVLVFTLMYFTRQTTDAEGSHSNFIQVEAWQKVAEVSAPLMVKGLEVLINGSIIQKRWNDNDGKMRSQFIFTADTITITDLKFSISDEDEEKSTSSTSAAAA